MSNAFDLIILGGGCAGLSLATRLASSTSGGLRTLVVDGRTRYTNDRTWCFWGADKSAAAYPLEHQWANMRLTSGDRTVLVDCSSTPYQMLPAERFYDAALSTLSTAENISLKLDTTVRSGPRKIDGHWEAETTAGVFSGRMMVDTRPQQFPARDGALLWQSFSGKEIACDDPVFEPSCMDLMNFLPPCQTCIPFVYVLPMSTTRALVEVTAFGADPLRPEDLASMLETAIAGRTGSAPFQVLRSEHGILPMGLRATPKNPDRSYVRAGVMAGAARPSTGFAFQRIQRWADACAKSILAGALPTSHAPDPVVLRGMDHLFLNVLRANPEKAGDLFCALFDGVETPRVIRFLNGKGAWLDYAAVISALPLSPFIRVLSRSLAGRAGRQGAGQQA
jgi:lycopene beta-cyclase